MSYVLPFIGHNSHIYPFHRLIQRLATSEWIIWVVYWLHTNSRGSSLTRRGESEVAVQWGCNRKLTAAATNGMGVSSRRSETGVHMSSGIEQQGQEIERKSGTRG